MEQPRTPAAAGELRPADGADDAAPVTAERLRDRVGWDVALRGILEAMHGDERAESAQATRTGVARVFVAWRTDPEHRARCPPGIRTS